MALFTGLGPAMREFARPAAARKELWRLGLGLVLILLLNGVLVLAYLGLAYLVLARLPGPWRAEMPFAEFLGDVGESPAGMLVALGTFGCLWLALAATLRLLHRRGLRSLLGRGERMAGRDFARGLSLALGFGMASVAAGLAIAGRPALAPDPGAWLLALGPALVLLFVQVGAEELLFRGYLQQQFAARFRAWPAALLGPSLLFGLAHYSPAQGDAALLAVLAATVTGLVFGAVTAATGNLGAALGLHYGINLVGLLAVSNPAHLGGLGLFRWPHGAYIGEMAWADLALLLPFGIACLAIFRAPAERPTAA
ncbi:MAG TPA: CPBP family intramembrane glutamic endopeptidase [Paracoccaceae bacterium]|nr:CPBP family intramembrane glutamic endopeptidase [Paracoccaceae bacterium]